MIKTSKDRKKGKNKSNKEADPFLINSTQFKLQYLKN
jgi:hypothetical protein